MMIMPYVPIQKEALLVYVIWVTQELVQFAQVSCLIVSVSVIS